MKRIFLILVKKIYLRLWLKINSKKGNIHLDSNTAILKKIPFHKYSCYLRPTISDSSRILEFVNGICFSNNYLHTKLKEQKPNILIDVGGNIGLATLNLVKEFNSLKKIIGIEAENFNFNMLKLNYNHFTTIFQNIKFDPLYALASCESGNSVKSDRSLKELGEKVTSSGTFRFIPEKNNDLNTKILKTVSLNDIIDNLTHEDKLIVKIDIEGGEQYLFEKNTKWVEKVMFLTIEIHDRYNIELINSSSNFIKALAENNFSIVPENDVIHCYNRNFF